MRVRRLEIAHFRGIASLDWWPAAECACLIGNGDAGKTSILDAIELALHPHWGVTFSDADFLACDTASPIVIRVTVGALPDALIAEDRLGHFLRGFVSPGNLNDEPADTDEPVVTVQLTVDATLEPRWTVYTDRRPDGPPASARDREALGMVRVGTDAARHLRWARGSALARGTARDQGASAALVHAHRIARDSVANAPLTELKRVASNLQDRAVQLGAGYASQLSPALDPSWSVAGPGPLSLHDGPVPVRCAGDGTQRLTAIAAQQLAIPDGAIVLIDEVEVGLEPHRLRHLLRTLRDGSESGQVVMTTHSSVSVEELGSEPLFVVMRDAQQTSVAAIPPSLQPHVRAMPEALLARSVVVCEGKTEVGLLRAFDRVWTVAHNAPMAHSGVVLTLGNGDESLSRAMAMRSLGYRVALLVDADKALVKSDHEIATAGIALFRWEGQRATEDAAFADLPLAGVQALVDLARGEADSDGALIGQLTAVGGPNLSAYGLDIAGALARGVDESELRRGLALAAKKNKRASGRSWFKRIDLGERLGEIVADQRPECQTSDLIRVLDGIGAWVHGS